MQPSHRFTDLTRTVPLAELAARLVAILGTLSPDEIAGVLQLLEGGGKAETKVPRHGGSLAALTAQERRIFDLAIQGTPNMAMARILGVSVKTIQTHRAAVNRKLGVRSPASLIAFAARQGLLRG